jgi:hypothetical protein
VRRIESQHAYRRKKSQNISNHIQTLGSDCDTISA